MRGRGQPSIHRHTGGLENLSKAHNTAIGIHRHTGGLENSICAVLRFKPIHRHTGGLENDSLQNA